MPPIDALKIGKASRASIYQLVFMVSPKSSDDFCNFFSVAQDIFHFSITRILWMRSQDIKSFLHVTWHVANTFQEEHPTPFPELWWAIFACNMKNFDFSSCATFCSILVAIPLNYGNWFCRLSVHLHLESIRLRPICRSVHLGFICKSFKTELFKSPCWTSQKNWVSIRNKPPFMVFVYLWLQRSIPSILQATNSSQQWYKCVALWTSELVTNAD